MAASTTTFAERMKRIEGGKTTSWTVPGEGLASYRDETSFVSKSGVKMQPRSTQKKAGLGRYALAVLTGMSCVVLARWLDFRFLDTALAWGADLGVDLAEILAGVPTASVLAALLSLVALLVLGLRKPVILLHGAGFLAAFLFEAELVALAPQVYAMLYPPAWVADMMASATLVT